ncbi:ankyrin repeat domain-containing protein 66-like isoform X1 [Hydractinia symbiolongicarpus]|uniref:ankyrin repeat domain-containing protein 66-like isoform X1 n=1 Tax=Hydractinia symbiolongicarpus TaxID=13093 RepID=UPI00254E029A|nr:ankyrin repeat domain-containing protein 66-like isoform X1 [Hydractinia symbiolongicarpus]
MADFFLHELAAVGDAKQLEILFRVNGVKDIDERDADFEGQAALHWAVRKGHVRCCKILLENGADASLRMYQGWTPAHCAAETGNLEILKLLFEYSGSLIAKDDYGSTPKHMAEVYGHKECVKFLEEVEQHPSQKREIIKDRIVNAARRTLLSSETNKQP